MPESISTSGSFDRVAHRHIVSPGQPCERVEGVPTHVTVCVGCNGSHEGVQAVRPHLHVASTLEDTEGALGRELGERTRRNGACARVSKLASQRCREERHSSRCVLPATTRKRRGRGRMPAECLEGDQPSRRRRSHAQLIAARG